MKLVSRIGLAVALVAVLTVTGCTPVPDFSARLVGGLLQIGICQELDVQRIRVSTVEKGGRDELDVWVAEGEFEIAAGTLIPLGEAPDGGVTSLGPGSLATDGNWVNVRLYELDSSGEVTVSNYAHFDGDKIDTERWLASNNSLRDNPC